jgi:hypothetical protein
VWLSGPSLLPCIYCSVRCSPLSVFKPSVCYPLSPENDYLGNSNHLWSLTRQYSYSEHMQSSGVIPSLFLTDTVTKVPSFGPSLNLTVSGNKQSSQPCSGLKKSSRPSFPSPPGWNGLREHSFSLCQAVNCSACIFAQFKKI